MKTIIVLEVDYSKPIKDLDNMVASRAYTIDGVTNVQIVDGQRLDQLIAMIALANPQDTDGWVFGPPPKRPMSLEPMSDADAAAEEADTLHHLWLDAMDEERRCKAAYEAAMLKASRRPKRD